MQSMDSLFGGGSSPLAAGTGKGDPHNPNDPNNPNMPDNPKPGDAKILDGKEYQYVDGKWVPVSGTTVEVRASKSDVSSLPTSGIASTYADKFVGKKTSSGDRYSHDKYTAAIMPQSRWYSIMLGTKLKLTHKKKTVVVKLNDRGAGDGSMERVLDLSRKAMGVLVGRDLQTEDDANSAGLITLDSIEVVDPSTPLGPPDGGH